MLKPLADYILLEELPPAERSASGLIVIPQNAQVKYNQGIVIEFGDEVKNLQAFIGKGSIKIGDIVVFPLHSEYRVEHRNRKYILIKASEIMAQIAPDNRPDDKAN